MAVWYLFENVLGHLKTKSPPNSSLDPPLPEFLLRDPNPINDSNQTAMCLISHMVSPRTVNDPIVLMGQN